MKDQLPKGIIFDWDETLVSSLPILQRAWRETIKFYLPEQADSIPTNRAGKSAKESFPPIFGDIWEEALEYYRSLYLKYRESGIMPKAFSIQLLDYLRSQNLFIGVVSNKISKFLRQEIELLNWQKYFDAIVGSLDCDYDKPSPEPIFKALEFTNIKPEEIWFIGDSIVDMECAVNAGSFPILYGNHEISSAELKLSKMHIESHEFLLTHIKKLK